MSVSFKSVRLSGEARRVQILDAAKHCFARHGFAGTTTKSVAAAAGVSEGLLFRHFPTKAALYAAILSEACEADPCLVNLQSLAPSTGTLVLLVREMVRCFLQVGEGSGEVEGQRLRLMFSSHLDDGEFARMLFQKIGNQVQPIFASSLERAIAAGDAKRIGDDVGNLFWFAHHTVMMLVLTRMPDEPTLSYGETLNLERQICEFVLRGVGLTDTAILFHLSRVPSSGAMFAKEIA